MQAHFLYKIREEKKKLAGGGAFKPSTIRKFSAHKLNFKNFFYYGCQTDLIFFLYHNVQVIKNTNELIKKIYIYLFAGQYLMDSI